MTTKRDTIRFRKCHSGYLPCDECIFKEHCKVLFHNQCMANHNNEIPDGTKNVYHLVLCEIEEYNKLKQIEKQWFLEYVEELYKFLYEPYIVDNEVTNKKDEHMTQKQKEMIKSWFDHIKQMATDRKTLNGVVMDDAHCLDEIRALALNASEFVERFWNDKEAWED